jgi:hypothetical protein
VGWPPPGEGRSGHRRGRGLLRRRFPRRGGARPRGGPRRRPVADATRPRWFDEGLAAYLETVGSGRERDPLRRPGPTLISEARSQGVFRSPRWSARLGNRGRRRRFSTTARRGCGFTCSGPRNRRMRAGVLARRGAWARREARPSGSTRRSLQSGNAPHKFRRYTPPRWFLRRNVRWP